MFAPALKNADVVAMKADVEIGRRLIDAYRLILEFCGMVLVNEATGACHSCCCTFCMRWNVLCVLVCLCARVICVHVCMFALFC